MVLNATLWHVVFVCIYILPHYCLLLPETAGYDTRTNVVLPSVIVA